MNSYKTIDEARNAAKSIESAVAIIEIKPDMEGVNPYIIARCNETVLRSELKHRPMPEIKDIVGTIVNLAKERIDARKAELEELIPGLGELQELVSAWSEYHEQQQRRYDNEQLSSISVRPPERKIEDVAAKYPVAVAYLKAKSYANASHHVKSSAGTKAMEKIENGGDYKVAIAEMEKTWTDYAHSYID